MKNKKKLKIQWKCKQPAASVNCFITEGIEKFNFLDSKIPVSF